jgi:hypothetical protein
MWSNSVPPTVKSWKSYEGKRRRSCYAWLAIYKPPLLNPSYTNNNNRQVANFRRFNACKNTSDMPTKQQAEYSYRWDSQESLDMERNLFKAQKFLLQNHYNTKPESVESVVCVRVTKTWEAKVVKALLCLNSGRYTWIRFPDRSTGRTCFPIWMRRTCKNCVRINEIWRREMVIGRLCLGNSDLEMRNLEELQDLCLSVQLSA